MINGVTAAMSPEAFIYYTTITHRAGVQKQHSDWLRRQTGSGTLANQEKHLSPFIKHYIIKGAG